MRGLIYQIWKAEKIAIASKYFYGHFSGLYNFLFSNEILNEPINKNENQQLDLAGKLGNKSESEDVE